METLNLTEPLWAGFQIGAMLFGPILGARIIIGLIRSG
jgi:hypothetical protein